MSNDYQEPMADGKDHPLKYVDPAVLIVAREVMATARIDLRDADLIEPLADAVVLELAKADHIRRRGDRETFIRMRARNMQLVAAMSAIRDISEETTAGYAQDALFRVNRIKEICDEQIARGWADAD